MWASRPTRTEAAPSPYGRTGHHPNKQRPQTFCEINPRWGEYYPTPARIFISWIFTIQLDNSKLKPSSDITCLQKCILTRMDGPAHEMTAPMWRGDDHIIIYKKWGQKGPEKFLGKGNSEEDIVKITTFHLEFWYRFSFHEVSGFFFFFIKFFL